MSFQNSRYWYSGLPTFDVRGYDEILAQSTWPYRVFGSIFGILAFIALVLSSVGIFGVTSYSVGQRTQEIGMRMALGAASTDVLWLVGKQGLKQVVAGLAFGLLGAFAMTRVLADFMFGVGTSDPTTFFVLSLLLTLVTLSACLVPARRAARLDPMDALRIE
jgi:ABC-type antimicrobial peptide transport system permease subunit